MHRGDTINLALPKVTEGGNAPRTPGAMDQINSYPFWGPSNSGPAERFAAPYAVTGVQVVERLKDLQRRGLNRVPQETEYSNSQTSVMQFVPAYVPLPQAPVQSRDPMASASSLLDYATQSLGSSVMGVADSRGTK